MTTPAVPFSATFASEWSKLTTLRSTYVTTVLSVVLAALTTAGAGIAVGATWDEWSATDRADFDPILFSLVGGILTGLVLPLLGVKAVTSEYSSGMIRLTLTATPRRGRLLLAKALAVASVTFGAGLAAALAMFLTGQAVYAAYGLESASLLEADALLAIVAVGATFTVFPVLAVAIAFQLRSTAATITAVLALIFVPPLVGTLLPSWFEDRVIAYLPGPASDSVSMSHLDGTEVPLSAGVAIVVLVVWLAAFLVAAWVVLQKRDA